jgi:hypothetical protein
MDGGRCGRWRQARWSERRPPRRDRSMFMNPTNGRESAASPFLVGLPLCVDLVPLADRRVSDGAPLPRGDTRFPARASLPVDRADERCLPRIPEGPYRAACLRRAGRGVEHAVADGRGGEGQGPVGAEGVRAPPVKGSQAHTALRWLLCCRRWIVRGWSSIGSRNWICGSQLLQRV